MKRIIVLLFLSLFMFSTVQSQELKRIVVNFKWQLFEDVTVKKNGKDVVYLSDFSTKTDSELEGVFADYYNKGWITKQGSIYELLAPEMVVWWIDTTKVGRDVLRLSNEDDMINIGAWATVYDLETLEPISPDSVYYTQVKYPQRTKVKSLATKRFPSDDPLRSSCSKGTFLSKQKEKEKKYKKDKDREKKNG